jgi:hypothetical protein
MAKPGYMTASARIKLGSAIIAVSHLNVSICGALPAICRGRPMWDHFQQGREECRDVDHSLLAIHHLALHPHVGRRHNMDLLLRLPRLAGQDKGFRGGRSSQEPRTGENCRAGL